VREGRLELPRPFGHRILRLLLPRTRLGSTGHSVLWGVVLFPPASFRREQVVSKAVGHEQDRSVDGRRALRLLPGVQIAHSRGPQRRSHLGSSGIASGSANLYLYGANSPTHLTDPWGSRLGGRSCRSGWPEHASLHRRVGA